MVELGLRNPVLLLLGVRVLMVIRDGCRTLWLLLLLGGLLLLGDTVGNLLELLLSNHHDIGLAQTAGGKVTGVDIFLGFLSKKILILPAVDDLPDS
jgi:hypothetical protein